MRIYFLLLSIGLLVLARCATIDSSTADWVLSLVCSDDVNDSVDPSKDDTVARPPCTKKKDKEDIVIQDKIRVSETDTENNKTDKPFSLNPTQGGSSMDCNTKNGDKGICILYYQCSPKTQTIIGDGASIIDFRSNECPHYLEVCCKDEEQETLEPYRFTSQDQDVVASPSPTPSSVVSPTTPQPTMGLASKKVLEKSKRKNTGCGWSNPGASPRLRSGETGEPDSPFAQYGDFPWIVALLKKSDDSGVWSDGDYLGGGTMIHPSAVLTVAHKLTVKGSRIKTKRYKAEELKCRAGEWDTQTTKELFQHQERDVDRYVIHEDYDFVSYLNDVALLILKTPYSLARAFHMGPGCLASALPAPGTECYSMGWGRDFTKEDKKLPSVLKKIKLNFVQHSRCEEMLRLTRLGHLFELHDSLTCANGTQGVDTCRGDGGSPLVCPITTNKGETRYAVYGMVVYGIDCGDPEKPGVYANIPRLRSWVDKAMKKAGLDTSYYTI